MGDTSVSVARSEVQRVFAFPAIAGGAELFATKLGVMPQPVMVVATQSVFGERGAHWFVPYAEAMGDRAVQAIAAAAWQPAFAAFTKRPTDTHASKIAGLLSVTLRTQAEAA